jgi:hypothetical protein
MRTLISVAGNICSGKTTICELLSKKLDIPFFSIDDYRVRYKAFSIEGERNAWDNLVIDIAKCNMAIFESSGVSVNINKVHKVFDKIITVLIDCDDKSALRRLYEKKMKGYSLVPYPFKRAPWPETINRIGTKLDKMKYDMKFNSVKMDPELITEKIIKSI